MRSPVPRFCRRSRSSSASASGGISRGGSVSNRMRVPTASEFDGSSAMARPASRSARPRASVAPGPAMSASAACSDAKRACSARSLAADLEVAVPVEEALDRLDEPRAHWRSDRAGSSAVARTQIASSSGGTSRSRRADARARVGARRASTRRPPRGGSCGCSGSSARSSKRIAPSAYTSARASTVARRAPARAACTRASPWSRRARSRAPGDRCRRSTAARSAAPRLRRAEQLREAPVEHVDLAEVAEHHVARLEIAVDDAARVGEVRRPGRRSRTPSGACAARTAARRPRRPSRSAATICSKVAPRRRFIVK